MKSNKLAALFFTCLLSILSAAAFAQPFVISADGSEVTDQETGLIWKRCSEGMSWNSTTCAGTAGTFTHEAALVQADTQATSTGIAWRLPNIKELSSIVDRSLISPAIGSTAFPATPASWCWSSSPYTANLIYALNIDFDDGSVRAGLRSSSYHVRLVRAGQ